MARCKAWEPHVVCAVQSLGMAANWNTTVTTIYNNKAHYGAFSLRNCCSHIRLNFLMTL